MMLQDNMLLYHTSYTIVDNINLDKSYDAKDFGRGFYLTRNEDDAQKFIKTSINKAIRYNNIKEQDFGYINIFRVNINDSDLSIYEFKEVCDRWLWFIAKNRKHNLSEILNGYVDKNIIKSDVIIGKIANDITNRTLAAYVDGIFGDLTNEKTIKYVLDLLLPNVLDYQFCFKTENSIKCLQFVEAKKYGI